MAVFSPHATTGQQQHNTTIVDVVWNHITCKQEKPDMMTLEDFLAKAGATERLLSGGCMLNFDNLPSNVNVDEDMTTRGQRRPILDPLQDKAVQQRQRRMIKNRESAARSRECKQIHLFLFLTKSPSLN
ncbi:hypothetical protein Tco_1301586 [Tanacetum coccineum]